MVTTRPEVPIMNELKSLKPTLLEPLEEKNISDLQLYFEHVLKNKFENNENLWTLKGWKPWEEKPKEEKKTKKKAKK